MLGESETRRRLIKKAIEKAAWSPIVYYRENIDVPTVAVEEYPTEKGPADYILFHKGKALACVEGKKVAIGPQNVLQQAKRYARDCMSSKGFGQIRH